MEKHYNLILNAMELYLLKQYLEDNGDHLPSVTDKIDKVLNKHNIVTPDNFKEK